MLLRFAFESSSFYCPVFLSWNLSDVLQNRLIEEELDSGNVLRHLDCNDQDRLSSRVELKCNVSVVLLFRRGFR